MKGRILAVVLSASVGLVLLFNGQEAKANHDPVSTINMIFSALNSGKVDTAVASFAEDAIFENRVRDETYSGVSEIRQVLQGMARDGRQFAIVDTEMEGDTITAEVEVSDGGIVWGTETIVALVKDGKLQTFNVAAFRLELWKIGR